MLFAAFWAGAAFGFGETALTADRFDLGESELLAAFLKMGLAAAPCLPGLWFAAAGFALAPPTSLSVRAAVFTFDVARWAETPEDALAVRSGN